MFAEMSEKYLHLAYVAILQRVKTFLQLAGVDLAGLAGLQSAPGWASFPSHGADLPLFMAGLPLQNIIGNSDHHLSHPSELQLSIQCGDSRSNLEAVHML